MRSEMRVIDRPGDLTGRICRRCLRPIFGDSYIERRERGQRMFECIMPCAPDPERFRKEPRR